MKKAALLFVVGVLFFQSFSALAAPNQTFLPLVMSSDPPAATNTPTETTIPPTATATETPVPPTATSTPGNCDAAYPTVCIPPPPPDLNCADIPYRNFTVLPPDPHHFDNNHDGSGCESP